MTRERAVFDLHANLPPLGRQRRGEAPSTVCLFLSPPSLSGLTNERVMTRRPSRLIPLSSRLPRPPVGADDSPLRVGRSTDRLSVPSTEARVGDAQLCRLSLGPEESWACGPPKVMKNASVRHPLSMEPLPFPCHPDRSEAERRDLRFRGPFVEMFFGPSGPVPACRGEICSCPTNHRTFTTTKPQT
jgi:hypothetical protein